MYSLAPLLLLFFIVMFWLIFPIKKQRVDFDEKDDVIKVYQDEIIHLERQHASGFIDANEKAQLLSELDNKSALAMTAIEKKTFSYQRSPIPLIAILLGLAAATGVYYQYYQKSGVMQWQSFYVTHHEAITEGLFDPRTIMQFLQQNDVKTGATYCFAMQQVLLAQYDTNADALANLALCHLSSGYPQLAEVAAKRGLTTQPQHTELNYIMAEVDFLKHQRLSATAVDHLLQTIKNKPKHFGALRLLAIHSLGQRDYQQARFFFTELKKLAANDAQLFAALEYMDKEIAQTIASEKKLVSTSQFPSATTLPLSITIAPSIAKTLKGSAILFIIIQSEQGQLLNASKHPIQDVNLPLTININEHQTNTMQTQAITNHKRVKVTARISHHGNPIAATGDLTSATQLVALPVKKVVKLLIDKTVS